MLLTSISSSDLAGIILVALSVLAVAGAVIGAFIWAALKDGQEFVRGEKSAVAAADVAAMIGTGLFARE